MISTLINALTAPSETFKSISESFDLKQSTIPILLLMAFAVLSSAILSEQICEIYSGNKLNKPSITIQI